MQTNVSEIRKASSQRLALAKSLNDLNEVLATNFATSYGAKFTSSNEGKSMAVSMPDIGQIASSNGRPVWNGKQWKFEYIFYVGHTEHRVEVFRFYLNDEAQVENAEGELFGSVEGSDFLNYVCGEVFVGTLNSSLYAATPSPANN